jgi:hypothetical protein
MIVAVAPNNVAAAVAHVNANVGANAGAYTLFIDTDTTVIAQQNLNTANRNLTIIGLGAERTIQYAGAVNQQLFNISVATASLTLGNNATLKGIPDGAATLVHVVNGNFIMKAGSKITGHSSNSVNGILSLTTGATFTMEGGIITGNNTRHTDAWVAGGLGVGIMLLEEQRKSAVCN